jgi:hypothetical protein
LLQPLNKGGYRPFQALESQLNCDSETKGIFAR